MCVGSTSRPRVVAHDTAPPRTYRSCADGCGLALFRVPQGCALVDVLAQHICERTRAGRRAALMCAARQGSLTLTPLNSLVYNLNPANLALHGTHPRWTHAVVNFPLLFGPAVLGIASVLRGAACALRVSWLDAPQCVCV